jgi:hypothetical protein
MRVAFSRMATTTKWITVCTGWAATPHADRPLWTLERLHLAQLDSAGQVDEVLAVLREDWTEAHAHSQVICHLEKHGRFREAFAQVEQGCKAFPDDWCLQDDRLRCYERDV